MNKYLQKLPLLEKIYFQALEQNWIRFLVFVIRHFVKDKCSQMAASMTYTTMLSIVPMLTISLVVLSSIPALDTVKEQIYNLIYSNLMPESSTQLKEYLNGFAEKSINLTTIGLIVLVYTTLMTLFKIELAFNHVWDADIYDKTLSTSTTRNLLKNIVYTLSRYFTIIIVVPLVLGVAFLASATIQSISFFNQQIHGYAINWAVWVKLLSFLITIIGFSMMYWFIPKTKVPIKHALISGALVAILFEIVKWLFSKAMSHSTNYATIYGAFAALPIFILWIHLSWNLILLGVEICFSLGHFRQQQTTENVDMLLE